MSKIPGKKGHTTTKGKLSSSIDEAPAPSVPPFARAPDLDIVNAEPEILPPEESSRDFTGSKAQLSELDGDLIQIEDDFSDDADSELDEQLIKFGKELSSRDDGPEDAEVSLPPALAEAPPSTTLDAYLREIRKYPILTKEEEHALALKVFHENDREAAYKLITSNLRLAVKIARDYERAAKNLMDLIQEGNIGLIDAVKNFDPYREVRFPSYAIWWIKAYIIRYVMANWRMVKIGTTQAQRRLFFNLKKERDRLEREGFTPRADILAKRLNVKEQEVIEMEQRLNGADMSVDAPLPADPETNLLALLPAEQKTAEEILEDKEFTNLFINSLKDFEATLNTKELAILKNRLLKDYEEQATLKELAAELSITHERVRQIEVRVKDKLKKYLLDHMGSALGSFNP